MVLPLLAACASSSIYGGTTAAVQRSATSSTGTSGTVSSGTTGTGTSGVTTGTATAGSASTGTSSTGGTTGRFACPNTLTDCASGQVEFLTQVWDPVLQAPVTRPVQMTDLDNEQLTATSDTNGILRFCATPGLLFAPQLIASGYTPTIYNDTVLATSDCTRQIPLNDDTFWQEVVSALPSDYDTSLATIVVTISNAVGFCSPSGWAVSAEQADGGLLDAGLVYISGLSIEAGATSTSASGSAILYNLDPNASDVQVIGTQVIVEDGGAVCGQDLGAAEHTGRIHIAGNGVISSFALVVADAG